MNVSSHGVIEDTFQGFCPPLSMHGNEAPGRYFNQATRRRCTTQRPGWYQLKCLHSQNHTWRFGLTARTFTSHRRQWIIFSATHRLYRSDSALTWGKKNPTNQSWHTQTHTHTRAAKNKTKQSSCTIHQSLAVFVWLPWGLVITPPTNKGASSLPSISASLDAVTCWNTSSLSSSPNRRRRAYEERKNKNEGEEVPWYFEALEHVFTCRVRV